MLGVCDGREKTYCDKEGSALVLYRPRSLEMWRAIPDRIPHCCLLIYSTMKLSTHDSPFACNHDSFLIGVRGLRGLVQWGDGEECLIRKEEWQYHHNCINDTSSSTTRNLVQGGVLALRDRRGVTKNLFEGLRTNISRKT